MVSSPGERSSLNSCGTARSVASSTSAGSEEQYDTSADQDQRIDENKRPGGDPQGIGGSIGKFINQISWFGAGLQRASQPRNSHGVRKPWSSGWWSEPAKGEVVESVLRQAAAPQGAVWTPEPLPIAFSPPRPPPAEGASPPPEVPLSALTSARLGDTKVSKLHKLLPPPIRAIADDGDDHRQDLSARSPTPHGAAQAVPPLAIPSAALSTVIEAAGVAAAEDQRTLLEIRTSVLAANHAGVAGAREELARLSSLLTQSSDGMSPVPPQADYRHAPAMPGTLRRNPALSRRLHGAMSHCPADTTAKVLSQDVVRAAPPVACLAPEAPPPMPEMQVERERSTAPDYVRRHGLDDFLRDALQALLDEQPERPMEFLVARIRRQGLPRAHQGEAGARRSKNKSSAEYLSEHRVEANLMEAMQQVLVQQPENPLELFAAILQARFRPDGSSSQSTSAVERPGTKQKHMKEATKEYCQERERWRESERSRKKEQHESHIEMLREQQSEQQRLIVDVLKLQQSEQQRLIAEQGRMIREQERKDREHLSQINALMAQHALQQRTIAEQEKIILEHTPKFMDGSQQAAHRVVPKKPARSQKERWSSDRKHRQSADSSTGSTQAQLFGFSTRHKQASSSSEAKPSGRKEKSQSLALSKPRSDEQSVSLCRCDSESDAQASGTGCSSSAASEPRAVRLLPLLAPLEDLWEPPCAPPSETSSLTSASPEPVGRIPEPQLAPPEFSMNENMSPNFVTFNDDSGSGAEQLCTAPSETRPSISSVGSVEVEGSVEPSCLLEGQPCRDLWLRKGEDDLCATFQGVSVKKSSVSLAPLELDDAPQRRTDAVSAMARWGAHASQKSLPEPPWSPSDSSANKQPLVEDPELQPILKEAKRIFKELDRNRNHSISKIELLRGLKASVEVRNFFGLPAHIRQEDAENRRALENVFQGIDRDQSKSLSWTELERWINEVKHLRSEHRCQTPSHAPALQFPVFAQTPDPPWRTSEGSFASPADKSSSSSAIATKQRSNDAQALGASLLSSLIELLEERPTEVDGTFGKWKSSQMLDVTAADARYTTKHERSTGPAGHHEDLDAPEHEVIQNLLRNLGLSQGSHSPIHRTHDEPAQQNRRRPSEDCMSWDRDSCSSGTCSILSANDMKCNPPLETGAAGCQSQHATLHRQLHLQHSPPKDSATFGKRHQSRQRRSHGSLILAASLEAQQEETAPEPPWATADSAPAANACNESEERGYHEASQHRSSFVKRRRASRVRRVIRNSIRSSSVEDGDVVDYVRGLYAEPVGSTSNVNDHRVNTRSLLEEHQGPDDSIGVKTAFSQMDSDQLSSAASSSPRMLDSHSVAECRHSPEMSEEGSPLTRTPTAFVGPSHPAPWSRPDVPTTPDWGHFPSDVQPPTNDREPPASSSRQSSAPASKPKAKAKQSFRSGGGASSTKGTSRSGGKPSRPRSATGVRGHRRSSEAFSGRRTSAGRASLQPQPFVIDNTNRQSLSVHGDENFLVKLLSPEGLKPLSKEGADTPACIPKTGMADEQHEATLTACEVEATEKSAVYSAAAGHDAASGDASSEDASFSDAGEAHDRRRRSDHRTRRNSSQNVPASGHAATSSSPLRKTGQGQNVNWRPVDQRLSLLKQRCQQVRENEADDKADPTKAPPDHVEKRRKSNARRSHGSVAEAGSSQLVLGPAPPQLVPEILVRSVEARESQSMLGGSPDERNVLEVLKAEDRRRSAARNSFTYWSLADAHTYEDADTPSPEAAISGDMKAADPDSKGSTSKEATGDGQHDDDALVVKTDSENSPAKPKPKEDTPWPQGPKGGIRVQKWQEDQLGEDQDDKVQETEAQRRKADRQPSKRSEDRKASTSTTEAATALAAAGQASRAVKHSDEEEEEEEEEEDEEEEEEEEDDEKEEHSDSEDEQQGKDSKQTDKDNELSDDAEAENSGSEDDAEEESEEEEEDEEDKKADKKSSQRRVTIQSDKQSENAEEEAEEEEEESEDEDGPDEDGSEDEEDSAEDSHANKTGMKGMRNSATTKW